MTKNPIINALGATLYIVFVASIVYYGPMLVDKVDSVIAPIAFLSLFVLSAACMGFIFLYQPFQLFLEGEKKESVTLFLKTLTAFAISTAVLVFVWFFLNTHPY